MARGKWLSEDEKTDIMRMRASGMAPAQIAAQMQRGIKTIQRVLSGAQAPTTEGVLPVRARVDAPASKEVPTQRMAPAIITNTQVIKRLASHPLVSHETGASQMQHGIKTIQPVLAPNLSEEAPTQQEVPAIVPPDVQVTKCSPSRSDAAQQASASLHKGGAKAAKAAKAPIRPKKLPRQHTASPKSSAPRQPHAIAVGSNSPKSADQDERAQNLEIERQVAVTSVRSVVSPAITALRQQGQRANSASSAAHDGQLSQPGRATTTASTPRRFDSNTGPFVIPDEDVEQEQEIPNPATATTTYTSPPRQLDSHSPPCVIPDDAIDQDQENTQLHQSLERQIGSMANLIPYDDSDDDSDDDMSVSSQPGTRAASSPPSQSEAEEPQGSFVAAAKVYQVMELTPQTDICQSPEASITAMGSPLLSFECQLRSSQASSWAPCASQIEPEPAAKKRKVSIDEAEPVHQDPVERAFGLLGQTFATSKASKLDLHEQRLALLFQRFQADVRLVRLEQKQARIQAPAITFSF